MINDDPKIVQNLVDVLIKQRNSAMSKVAELEAQLKTISDRLEKEENKKLAEDLFSIKAKRIL